MAVTVIRPAPTQLQAGPREHALQTALNDDNFFRWSLTAANADTFDTKLPGIVEVAIAGTRALTTPSGPGTVAAGVSVSAISAAGVVTFTVSSGTPAFDLLVWAK